MIVGIVIIGHVTVPLIKLQDEHTHMSVLYIDSANRIPLSEKLVK
jgi:hypothetical protein